MPFSCEKLAPALLVLERSIFLILYKIVRCILPIRKDSESAALDQKGSTRVEQDYVNKQRPFLKVDTTHLYKLYLFGKTVL